MVRSEASALLMPLKRDHSPVASARTRLCSMQGEHLSCAAGVLYALVATRLRSTVAARQQRWPKPIADFAPGKLPISLLAASALTTLARDVRTASWRPDASLQDAPRPAYRYYGARSTSNRLQFPRLPAAAKAVNNQQTWGSHDDDPRLPLRRLRRCGAAHGARGRIKEGLEPVIPSANLRDAAGAPDHRWRHGFHSTRKLLRRRRAVISRQAYSLKAAERTRARRVARRKSRLWWERRLCSVCRIYRCFNDRR